MSNDQAKRGVHLSSGTGIVAHLDGLTAFADGDETELNTLVVRFNALAGEPWQEIIRSLTTEITALGYDAHPTLACVSVEQDRVAAFVFGNTTLSLLIDGSETVLNGNDSSTWIDVAIRGDLERIVAGTQSESPLVGILRDGVVPAGGFMLDTHGPMPTSGRWLDQMQQTASQNTELTDEPSAIAEPAPEAESDGQSGGLFTRLDTRIRQDEPDSSPASPEKPAVVEDVAPAFDPFGALAENPLDEVAPEPDPFELFTSNPDPYEFVDLEPIASPPETLNAAVAEPVQPVAGESGDPAEGILPQRPVSSGEAPETSTILTEARPQIRGVRCDQGHLTKPDSSSCRTCSSPISKWAKEETGDRPSLGKLTFDDGAVLSIDYPAAVGTNVPAGYTINDEPATIVRLDDGVGGIDDIHLEVRLSGWNVDVADMGSSGGTYSMLNGDRQTRTKLRTGQTVTLQPGTKIEAGARSFTYSVGPT